MTLLALHGKLHQLRRMAIYDEFCQTESAVVLIATDVAARGLGKYYKQILELEFWIFLSQFFFVKEYQFRSTFFVKGGSD